MSGLFLALEGIDGAGKTTAAQAAAALLCRQGRPAVALGRGAGGRVSPYVAGHMAGLRELIWGEPPGAPYLELGDEHWVLLQAAWYSAAARCVVAPAVAAGYVVLADTWGYKFLAKLRLRPAGAVSFERAQGVFSAITQPDVVVHLRADPVVAAARKPVFSGSETGNREGDPDLSVCAFTVYQQRLAGVLESFACRSGWVSLDASSLGREETGAAVAGIAERYLARLVTAVPVAGGGGGA